MLNVTLVGDTALMARLKGMPEKVHAALLKKVSALALKLEAKAKKKLTGDVLRVRTGALRRSIFNRIADSSTSVIGKVASSGDVKYAGIHEFGGTIKHPGGTPYIVTKDGAAFISKAKAAALSAVKFTAPHNITMPERSFLRSSLGDMRGEITDGLKQAVTEGVKNK